MGNYMHHHERTITLACMGAALLWAFSGLFILAGTVVAITADGQVGLAVAISLMVHGLALTGGAATVTMRNGLAAQNKLLADAFRLGQESQTGVRRVGS